MTKLADKYQAEMDKLAKKYVQITPNQVIKVARDRGNPLHDWFEWNTTKGHQLYLEHRARQLLNQHQITIEVENVEYTLKGFIANPMKEDEPSEYLSVVAVRDDTEIQKRNLHTEIGRAMSVIQHQIENMNYWEFPLPVTRLTKAVKELRKFRDEMDELDM